MAAPVLMEGANLVATQTTALALLANCFQWPSLRPRLISHPAVVKAAGF